MAENVFQTELKKLNAAQRLAVETIEGPVMVVAGPGTGKTQVVAMRIANILEQTQLGAKNILALTFTEVGVTALRDRLTQYAGPLAYQVTIATFHGFANEIIGTFPHIFTGTRQLTQIDELERLLIIEKIIKKLSSIKLLRPLRKETAHIRDIASAIKQCKQESVSFAQISAYAKKLSKKAATETKKLEQEKLHRQKVILAEFSDVFASYLQELSNSSYYDYEDMILFVIDALRENKEVKAYFQERYQYVMVDEYQDTNNAQNTLVELLADFFETPNLFVVGDDKQAIYRFQGASVANMLHFHQRYPQLAIISLRENYRSTPEILATALKLISNNTQQLSASIPTLSSDLVSQQQPGKLPKLLVCPTPISEQVELVQLLNKYHQDGFNWEKMAVLLRTNAEVNAFRDVLEKAGLPVAGVQTTNLLQEKEVQILLQLLRAILSPTNNTAVTLYLKLTSKPKDLLDLIDVIRLARETKESVIKVASKANSSIAARAQTLLRHHQDCDKLALTELLEKILHESGIIESIRSRPNTLTGLELISAIIAHAREYSLKNQSTSLKDWLDYMDLHTTYGVNFSINRSRSESTGVHVSTVHQAKGMEYEVVIIPNATERSWKVKPDRSVVKIPAELLTIEESNDPIQDLRRLFYVAITRPKKHLVFLYSATDKDGKAQLPSQLISEVESTITFVTPKVNTKVIEKFISAQISPLPEDVITTAELNYIRELVQSKPLSFTSYWDYLQCPRTYLLKHVYAFPTPFEPSLTYGESVHSALEQFARTHKAFKKVPSKSVLLTFFQEALLKNLPFGDRQQFVDQGLDVLSDYYDKVLVNDRVPLETEYNFRPHHIQLNGMGLTGKIDRIELVNSDVKKVRVIDYKTGANSRSRNHIEGNTQDSDGRMKIQLIFYAMLCRVDPLFPYNAVEFELRFIDDKKTFSHEVFTISDQEVSSLQVDVSRVYQEIISAKHFPIGNPESEIAMLFPSLT